MNCSTLCSLLVTLCLILIFQSPLPTKAGRSHVHHRLLGAGASPDLIDIVCNETIEDYGLCQEVLRRDPEIVKAKNFTELAQAILKLGAKEAVEGQNFLKGLAKEKHVPVIEDCAADYDGVIRALRSSLGEMKYDMPAANYDARIAGDGADYCSTALVAADIDNPKIFALNRRVSMIGFMAFNAMDKIGPE
ncbi:hypothetical protein LR48_Vigan07g025500 [Vigna angularis]|uniref:Pectinesterase inhibitor domain-containing protein n=2 Tax=Phaseolus angularis TaxID=3914 RepID=A0A0L9UV07_PHAAN|nr:uncharacterized protein LOC108337625 [Vigna angularis]KAG2390811.1 uncharacterized protein HKW66_Vig0134280 [Vigna angularis]KOM46551.1 hypothetical protein LR48_Vigan07g025500 [Vigna angularis]BAT80675.1 hypothetical protein VIGAN_03027200 [Vigna angularis var. angularis]